MQTVNRPLTLPRNGAPGDSCSACGVVLAEDQRYCLECGTRRAGGPPTLPGGAAFGARREAIIEPQPVGAPVTAAPPWQRSTNASLLAGVGCLLLALGIGVLIGRAGGSSHSVAPATPQVISVAGAGASATPAAAINDDWPAGKSGYTVALQELPTSTTQPSDIAAAKSAASAKGAPGVGVLKSDNYSGLAPGSYIVYSGAYSTKTQADKALRKLAAKIPGAKVIRVTSSSAATGSSAAASPAPAAPAAKPSAAVKQLQSATGNNYVKQSRKLPKTVATGGAPPPKDNKPAAGGSSFQTIGP